MLSFYVFCYTNLIFFVNLIFILKSDTLSLCQDQFSYYWTAGAEVGVPGCVGTSSPED